MRNRKLAGFTLLLCSFALLSVAAFGQDAASKKDFAEMSNQGSSVVWSINAQHRSLTLTVSAPNGEVYRQEYPAGSSPVFSLPSGDFEVNGSYKFEITLTPVLSREAEEMIRGASRDGSDSEMEAEMRKRGLLSEPMIQSGSFRVMNGQIVTKVDSAVEAQENRKDTGGGTTTKKEPRVNSGDTTNNAGDTDDPTDSVTVINMDLVVLGSECIGLDCPNNPSFGFDTLRLQENNLRINFLDTSNTASFPTRDWRITVNDSANGGQEKFSIDDVDAGRTPFTIEGNAAANSLYVDSTSRIGFKTATPVVELHSRDGDTPTLRLEQDGSSGFTAQTWDIAGNEANFFIRDVTNGSRLPFKIRPGASTDSMVIEANGDTSIKNNIQYSGKGSSAIPPQGAQQFYGGQAVLLGMPSSNIVPALDNNSFGVNTNAQPGFATFLINVPSSLNLATSTATNVVYKIRYQDPDGTGADSAVVIAVIGNNISDGTRTIQTVFNSNSDAATGVNTVTICQASNGSFFNWASLATHLNVVMIGTAALTARFFQVQVYKINVAC